MCRITLKKLSKRIAKYHNKHCKSKCSSSLFLKSFTATEILKHFESYQHLSETGSEIVPKFQKATLSPSITSMNSLFQSLSTQIHNHELVRTSQSIVVIPSGLTDPEKRTLYRLHNILENRVCIVTDSGYRHLLEVEMKIPPSSSETEKPTQNSSMKSKQTEESNHSRHRNSNTTIDAPSREENEEEDGKDEEVKNSKKRKN